MYLEIISFITCVIFGIAWITYPEKNIEPWLFLFMLVFILSEFLRRYHFDETQVVNENDIHLFNEYKKLFVDNGVANFYKSHDFLGAFQQEFWSPLSRYVDGWDNVEHEFVDTELQALHKEVYGSASKLGITIAGNTVPIGKGGHMRSVKPDSMPFGPTPEHIINEAKEINSLVPDFINKHEAFVRLANTKLY